MKNYTLSDIRIYGPWFRAAGSRESEHEEKISGSLELCTSLVT